MSSTVELEPPAPVDGLLEVGLTELEIETAMRCPPLLRGYCPWEADGAVFDAGRVRRVLRALGYLRHTKTTRWIGKPLRPDPWQTVWFLAPVFGWVYADTRLRVVGESYLEVPRKNGKTTLSTGLTVYLTGADGEPGAEVYSAAVDKTGAQRIVDDAKTMIQASAGVRSHMLCQASIVKHPASNSFFRALSKVAEAAHGLNVHAAIIDELHVHKTRDLVDAIVSGVGSRDQPLIIIITTADEGDDYTIYAEYRERTERQAQGVISDPGFYGVVFAAPEPDEVEAAGGDPVDYLFELETVRAANPGYGTALNPSIVDGEIEKAKSTPTYLPTYKRLRLNLRASSVATLISKRDWRQASAIQMHPRLAGEICYGGFDLSSTTDFTAAALVFPPADGDGDEGIFDVLVRVWIPEEAVERLEHQCQVPLRQWIRDGWLHTTEGNVVDYRPMRRWFTDADDRYGLEWIGYDRYNATETVNEMTDAGHLLEPVGQGYASMSAPLKLLERLVKTGRLRHAGNPVLAWMAYSLAVRVDETDNLRPIKPPRHKARRRIDGMSATLDALFGWQAYGRHARSVYDGEGLKTLAADE